MTRRPNADALRLAADWVANYEAQDDPSDAEAALPKVAAWLREEADRAEEAAFVRRAQREVPRAFPLRARNRP